MCWWPFLLSFVVLGGHVWSPASVWDGTGVSIQASRKPSSLLQRICYFHPDNIPSSFLEGLVVDGIAVGNQASAGGMWRGMQPMTCRSTNPVTNPVPNPITKSGGGTCKPRQRSCVREGCSCSMQESPDFPFCTPHPIGSHWPGQGLLKRRGLALCWSPQVKSLEGNFSENSDAFQNGCLTQTPKSVLLVHLHLQHFQGEAIVNDMEMSPCYHKNQDFCPCSSTLH